MSEKLDQKEKALSLQIARTALRKGRELDELEGDDLMNVIGAMTLLNHAQMVVGVDIKMARRLLDKANSK